MTEKKERTPIQINNDELWGYLKKKSRKKPIQRPVLSREGEKKRSERLMKIYEKCLKPDGTFTLPNGNVKKIRSITYEGILVLEDYGNYDLLQE